MLHCFSGAAFCFNFVRSSPCISSAYFRAMESKLCQTDAPLTHGDSFESSKAQLCDLTIPRTPRITLAVLQPTISRFLPNPLAKCQVCHWVWANGGVCTTGLKSPRRALNQIKIYNRHLQGSGEETQDSRPPTCVTDQRTKAEGAICGSQNQIKFYYRNRHRNWHTSNIGVSPATPR